MYTLAWTLTCTVFKYDFHFQLSPAYSGGSAPSPGYGEGRSGWAGPPVSGQHGPGSPGPPNTTAPASQPSPQPPSHSPGPGLPPSPQHQQQSQHQGFPNRPAQPTTPNAHAPDAAVSVTPPPPLNRRNVLMIMINCYVTVRYN